MSLHVGWADIFSHRPCGLIGLKQVSTEVNDGLLPKRPWEKVQDCLVNVKVDPSCILVMVQKNIDVIICFRRSRFVLAIIQLAEQEGTRDGLAYN